MTVIFYNRIPSSQIVTKKSQSTLVAPPGISMEELSSAATAQVATTIIHELEHRLENEEKIKQTSPDQYSENDWFQKVISGQFRPKINFNEPQSEQRAEKAEDRSGLLPLTTLKETVFDDSTTTESMPQETILQKAVEMANNNNPIGFYIPPADVVDKKLPKDRWGQYQMTNWTINKLEVDTEAIIESYNNQVSDRGEKPQNSYRQPPINQPTQTPVTTDPNPNKSVPTIPAIPSVPSI